MSFAWLTLAGTASATVCQTGPQTLSQMPSGKSSGPLTVPVRGLRAYLINGKVWRRVAIQIDERDANGDYVLEHGLPFTADGGDSRFNHKDELVIDLPENFSDNYNSVWVDIDSDLFKHEEAHRMYHEYLDQT